MTRLANILVAGADNERREWLVETLRANDLKVMTEASPAALINAARRDRPDLLIADIEASELDGLQLARDMRGDGQTADIPVVLAGCRRSALGFEKALEVGADDYIATPANEEEIVIRLTPLLRLSTMHAERARRDGLARQFGLSPDDGTGERRESELRSILTVGTDAAERALIEDILDGKGSLSVGDDLPAAHSLLADGTYDACVLCLGAEGDAPACLEFCDDVRNNPRLFNLPVLLLASPGTFADPVEPLRHGASRVMERGLNEPELRYDLTTLVKRQRLRWSLRQALQRTKQGAAVDRSTGTYAWEFLRQHLENLIGAARAWEKPLTVVFFSVPGIAEARSQFGDHAGAHLTRQLAQWITALVRAEDLTARHGEHDFCVSLPDTPLHEAGIVMNRVAGILSYTDFAVPEVYQPIAVEVEIGMAESEPRDTAESLIARARENLD
jgi:two-component system cell cycle response regulator